MEWKIPKLWEGGECWIIGGGPSMPRQFGVPEDVISDVHDKKISPSAYSPYLSPIHGKHIIAVNAAFYIGRWMDIVFFGDGGFYFKNKKPLSEFPNLVVSCNPNVYGRPNVYGVKYVARDGNHPLGITTKRNKVSWNKHTGGAAINFAYHLGVKRILLLGFDMQLDEQGNQHWHSVYPSANSKPRLKKQLPFRKHLESFHPIHNDAERLGIEILNVNMDSAVPHIKKVRLEETL